MNATWMLQAGGRRLPVEHAREGKKIALVFRNFEPLRNEIKAMRGAEFRTGPNRWVVTDCPRNRIQLALLRGESPPELERYDVPLDESLQPRRKNLRAHQVRIFRHELTRRGSIVAAEMGTGKTLPTIETMERVGGEWWYVGPKKVLDSVKLEFRKWNAQVEPKWVTYNMLRKEMERLPKNAKAPRGVVFDESSFLKSPGAVWTGAAQHLADAIREENDGYVILLSGQPAPKDPVDWWSQAEIARPGFLREASAERCRQRLINVKEYGETADGQKFPLVWEWKMNEVELLSRRLDGLVLVVMAKDCQDLPELQEVRVHLEPTEATLRSARLLANTAASAMQALDKCRQLSDGFQYQDSGTKRIATPKDGALTDFLAKNEHVGRTMVYGAYRESIDRAVEVTLRAGWHVLRCDGRGWAAFKPAKGMLRCTCAGNLCKCDGELDWKVVTQRKFDRDEWLLNLDRTQDPESIAQIAMVGHPKSGGYGLNLTACRQGVAYSLDFDYGSHAQLKKRGHREGMDLAHGFTMFYLCHLPTDAYVLDNHEKKKALQSITLGEVQEVLRA